MNWNYWLPWRTEDSTSERLVIKGEEKGRIIINESLQDEEEQE